MSSKHRISKLHPEVYSYVSYSKLFPKVTPSFKYFKNQLEKLDLVETVLVLSKLNLLMSGRKYVANQSFQQYLYKYFLNDYHREKILSLLKREGDIYFLFHRHQLLFLLKNIFLYSKRLPGINFKIPTVMERFGKCALLANDFLGPLGIKNEDLKNSGKEEKREVLWKELLPSYEISIPSSLMFDIGRIRLFFKKILPKLYEDKTYIDIDKKFQGYSGFSLDDFMFIIFAILVLYMIRRDEIISNPQAIFIDVENFTRHSDISSENVLKLLNLISIPIEHYKNEILKSKDVDLNYGFLPFKKYPLARIYEGKYLCLDFNFLLDKISNGIFWLINDKLPSSEREKFHTFWGKIFESYLIYFFEETKLLKKDRFIPKPLFDSSENEVADSILNFGEDLVLFEYKFTILTQKAKYSSSKNELIDEIKIKFEKNQKGEWKGYGQLANNINKLLSKDNRFTCKYINKKKIKRIYPVLITYEHIFNAPFTNYFLNKYFENLINFSSINGHIEIKPLVVFTVEDFEAAQPFLNDFSRLIQERLDFDEELDWSFYDFLKQKYQENKSLKSELIWNEYHKYAEEVTRTFFPDKKIKLPPYDKDNI